MGFVYCTLHNLFTCVELKKRVERKGFKFIEFQMGSIDENCLARSKEIITWKCWTNDITVFANFGFNHYWVTHTVHVWVKRAKKCGKSENACNPKFGRCER